MAIRETRLVEARFVSRPNRFIVRARLRRDGLDRTVDAHLADPGRLRELLRPGVRLRLRPAPRGSTRRTRFTVALVAAPGRSTVWVSVEAARANPLAGELLRAGAIDGIDAGCSVKSEVRHGDSRFDFLLEGPGKRRHWVEVKSVTFVEDGTAKFPDAPTSRGLRHVSGLAERARAGERATILFVVQRGDARVVTPYREIDPAFARALVAAQRDRVGMAAVRFRMKSDGGAEYTGSLPVEL